MNMPMLEKIRTLNPQIHSLVLYRIELQAQTQGQIERLRRGDLEPRNWL